MRRSDFTCGPLYRRARQSITEGDDPVKNRAFAAGFMVGQAEKVYLGACDAAMFRPTSTVGRNLVEAWADSIAHLYGLKAATITYADPSRDNDEVFEVWLCRSADVAEAVNQLTARFTVNSHSWHRTRGSLTGVRDIDLHFHERQSVGDLDGTLCPEASP